MNDETALAFAPLDHRAAAFGSDPADRISLRDYTVEVEIGAFQLEREVQQRVRFNVVVEVAPVVADDDVDAILSYDRVIEAIDAELAAERVNLLETLADRIAARILTHAQATRVFVRIEKTDRGPFVLGVEIVRGRGANAGETPVADAPRPRIVFLARGVLAGDDVRARLDPLIEDAVPLVICTQGVAEYTTDPECVAERRIALLAVEQAAWALSARDDRLAVVATRTELDWAMRNGQPCIWAPSRIVFDTPGAPHTGDARALAAWFAGEMYARELVVVGADAPECAVPVRVL